MEPGSLMMGSKGVTHWTSEMACECNEIAGSPQGSPPPTAANYVSCDTRRRPAASVKLGQKSCVRSSGIITLLAQRPSDFRQGHNDQSCWGHQCSKTTLTGESWFHISTSLGIEPGSLMTGSKRVDHWTRGTVCACRLST
jgi:hypothetical protein